MGYFYHDSEILPDSKGQQYPVLSTRRNIVVIADGRTAASTTSLTDSHATCMMLAECLLHRIHRYTIERDDRSTPAVFGDYIDKYDILRAVEDGVMPIYYEGRLAKIDL